MRHPLTAPPSQPFRIGIDHDGQRVILPLRGEWKRATLTLAAAFGLSVLHSRDAWGRPLTDGWTAAIYAGFAVTMLAATATLIFTFFGREVISLKCGQLVHSWTAFGIRRSRTFELARIESVVLADRMVGPGEKKVSEGDPVSPLRDFGKRGPIKIDDHAVSRYLGAALDEDAARAVIAWLRPWLPRNVTVGEERPRRFSDIGR